MIASRSIKAAAFALICTFLLSACAMDKYAQNSLIRKNIYITSTETFPHCHSYGCDKKAQISFHEKDWRKIETDFTPAPQTSEEERRAISNAISTFEILAGEKAGTANDKGGTFRRMMADGTQLDCVDESLNTTIYLTLLERKSLLKYHNVGAPEVRLPLIHAGRWPHQTATIIDKDTQITYAADSWFHDNGYPAEIITLQKWKKGWKPNAILQH